ncbi:MAG: homoserine kinase [Bacteroidetes bacterium]|nr:homoserine kinase [Bacteroidota bacterium]
MKDSIKVFSPATVANVGSGFDILGFALNNRGDIIEAKMNNEKCIRIFNQSGTDLPLNPLKNVAGVAVQSMLTDLKTGQGFDITFHQKISPGSGIGSSAASSAGSVFAINELLDNPYTLKELVRFAMQGEKAASGVAHADNVAPALLGGFTLIRSYNPLDVIQLPSPKNLLCTIAHPDIIVRTEDSRRILTKEILLKDAVIQWGNVAGLVSGLYTNDFELIGRSLQDVIIEPIRALLIPGFDKIKKTVLEAGALGCSISGSGPSIFALSNSEGVAQIVEQTMKKIFNGMDIEVDIFTSTINRQGQKII